MPLTHRHRPACRNFREGFTLIELAVVVFLLSLMAAIAIPRLLPVIAYSELEGTARRLAGYGQGAMGHSALLRERIVVRIDLSEQQVYTVHWILPEKEAAEQAAAEAEPDQLAKLALLREKGIGSQADLQEKLGSGKGLSDILSDDDGAFDSELAGFQMTDKFNVFARQALEVRAENVKHDESFLDDVGLDLSEENIFDPDAEEPVEEELGDPILRRIGFSSNAQIVGVELDGEYTSRGVVEVEFSVLGLGQRVVIFVENEDGDAFTVLWDPISNRSNVFVGRGTEQ